MTSIMVLPVVAQTHKECVLDKPGTLKKSMKGNENVTSLTVSGSFNEKDLLYIYSLSNLKVLDLKNAKISEKTDWAKLLVYRDKMSLDTLKISAGYNLRESRSRLKFPDGKSCFYSYYYIFNPRYLVDNNLVSINYYKEVPNNIYCGINIFPRVPLAKEEIKISGTLYLNDAISVNDYFSNTDITRIVFSKKIRKIEKHAFLWCHKLSDIIFEDSTNVEIDKDVFPTRGIGINERTIIGRIRVPHGQIKKFESMGFPKSILIDKNPDIKLEIEVKTPGSLAKQLDKVDLRLIQSLKISGILNSDDFKTINEMISLEKLDIKDAIVFVSIAQKKADAEAVSSLLGMANEAQFQKDGNYQNYKIRKRVNDRVEQGYDKTITCELPRNAFLGNPLLECLQLPISLTNINRAGIGGSEGYSLSGKSRLKELWISRASAERIPIKRIVDESKVQIRYY